MAKKYKAKYVSADEYNIKKNYISPEEYAQLEKQRRNEAERKRQLKKQEEIKRQREASSARTKAWQEAYNDAKNAGGEDKSWQVYAAKMISDTPGALEKEQERERKRQEEIARQKRLFIQSNFGTPVRGATLKNELTEKFGPYRTQQNALKNYIEALKESKAAKEQSYPTLTGQKQHGPIDKPEKVFSRFLTNLNKKQQERNQSIQGGREGYKAATGMITNNGQKQFGVRTFNDFAQLMQRRGAKGELNNSGNPLFMNEEGRAAYREAAEQKQTKADTMLSDFEKNRDAWSPEQKWESVFDMLEDRAEQNEERILHGKYTPEQQAVAGRKLSNMQGTRESRKQDVMEKAKDFFQFQYKKEEWENIDDENPDYMSSQDRRELLYDQIMPDTYAERTARMTAEEKAQLDSLIDAVFEDAAGTELDWFKNEDEYKRLIRESNSELQEADKVEQYQRDYDYFTNWANEYGTEGSPFKGGPLDGSYDPSLVQTQETLKGGKYSVKITEPTGSRTDKAYYYMNNVPELGAYGNVSGTEKKEYFATPEMVDTFNKLYKYDREKGSNMAEQFLDGIDYYLTSCMNLYHEYDVRRLSEDPVFGITARAGSYIANAAMAPVNLINTGLAMAGNKDAADPNNTINQINRDIQTLRENQNEIADEAIAQLIPFMKGKTNFLLNVGDSIIDNVVAMGAAKMLAPGMTSNEASQKLGMRLVQLIMSGEATGHTFVQKLDQGMDAGEAAIYAIGDGIIEWFTERVSLEALLKPDVRAMLGNKKELLKFIGKTTLAEGSEEVAADLLNWGLDYIMSMAYEHKTELESRRDELIASGMDKDKAWQQALTEKFEQIGLSGLAGGISGGVMGIGRIGMNTVNQIRTGSMTKNTQVNGLTGTEGLLEIAKEMNGEMSVKQAEAIQQKIDNGQEVSSKELGKLAQTIQMETSEKLNNPGGVTINEYITGMDTLKSVAEYTGQVKAEENRTSSIWAKPDEIRELEQKGKGRIQGNREAIWYDEKTGDGRFVKIDNVKTVQDKDDGNKWKLKLTVTVDGKQQDVNATDLKMTDYKTAKILYMASTKPEYFSGEFTQTLLDAAEKGQFSDDNRMMDRQLRDAQLIRLYAYAGQETDSLKLASLDRDTQNRIWLQSADEHRQNRQQQVKDAGAQRSSKITYRGAEYGTKEWNDVVKEMPKNMRAQMDVIAAVAQKAGVSVDFEDLSDEKLYGWENKNDKKIGINVNGINFDTITGERSGRHHMLVTFGHEFTHWMMQHSMAGYNRLEQYVLKSYMKERGAVGLQNVIESYRMGEDHLNLEDAIAEIVAEASDSVLMDENVVRHIQESDNKLYTEIKKFATDLVGRLKEAIGLMPDSQSSIRRVLANYANEINRLWTGAFDEALSGYITEDNGKQLTPEEYRQMVEEETGTTAEDISRMSRAQLDNEYMDAVESGDEINQIRYVEEAARRAGYTDLAYHGTKMFGFTNFDMAAGQGMAFVAYNERLAKSYTTAGELRNISSRTGIPVNFYTLNDSELSEYVKDIFNRWGMMGVTSVRKIEGGENKSDVDLFEVKHKNDWEKNETTSKYRRFELYQALEEYTNPNAELDGIYQLYTKPKNQLVIDAEGKLWNEIPFDLYGVKVNGSIDEETYEYTDTEWDEDFDPDIPHDVTANTREIAKWAKAHGYDSVRINNVSDNGGRNIELYDEGAEQVYGDIGIFFNENDIKSADPIVYDDNGDVIPLSERFNDQKTDIRWSRALSAEQQAEVDAAEEQGIDLNPVNQTASMYFSRASFERSEYFKDPEKMARMLAKNVLGSESKANIAKATKWIKDVTSISAMIAERPEIRDYFASPGRSSFKSNPEYGGSIDSSTICAKRRLQTGTLDAIQRALPDYAMTAEDFLRVRRMMKEKGYEVSCGLCFVESSRKNIAKYAKQFMNEWNSQHPENQVNMVQINTVLGLEDTRINNEEVYKAYEKFMNKLAQRKPKLFEMRSEYDNDIIKHFKKDESVEAKNRNGGMRINSFSDFEIVHLIDMMQVIMDMSNVGLAGQAYTKVKEFVQALGPTGLKINMSMIAAGVDENGKIIFDEIEGMKWSDVKDLRDKYADNVGTVCVVFTEDQLFAAMADDRIDFIIPFHRSQWNKSNYKDIGLPENVKDFTYWQNERYATPVYGTKKDGTPKKLRATNYMPNEYWNPELSGKENAKEYLKMCAENNKIPKFWKWLQPNGDGSFRLKDDGSTDGYWKLLGDFKMYNHLTGEYAPQMPVKPEFDMEQSRRMLEEYKGGHESFPEASDVVQEFVKEKKQGRKGLSTGKNGRIQLAGNEIESRMSRWTESGMDVNYWMEHVTPSALQTEDEWKMVQAYRGKRTSMALSLKKQLDMKAQIRALEGKAELTGEQRDELTKLRNNLKTEQDKYDRLENEIADITSDSGWAGIMRQHNVVFRDYMEGKTQEQVQAAIDSLTEEVKRSDKRITDLEKDLAKLEEQNPVKTVKKLMARKGLSRTVNALRSEYSTAMSEEEMKNRMAEIVIKNASGEDITTDVEALARDVLGRIRGEQNENLAYLRGTTLNIGESILDEYIAERGLLNEVRKNDRESDETVQKRARKTALQEIRGKIKGSGVRIVAEGKTRFREQWNDLRERNGGLRDISGYRNENDALNDILDDISGYMETSAGNQQYNMGPEQETELEAFITASANIMLNEETGGMNKTQLIEAIRKGAGPISQALAAVREVKGSMEGMKAAGQKAQTWAGVLNEDTQQALKYYNKMARLAAETERKRVKQNVIESLKSDHAKAMLQQAEKFREQMANDKKARELAADNAALRKQISTVSMRFANRIFAETDRENVPEETKALVRQVLDMISKHDAYNENEEGFLRKVTLWDKQEVDNVRQRLMKMIAHYGQFNPDTDLDWLVVKAENPADNDYTAQEKVIQDLIDIETGLLEYRNAEGHGRISLADRKAALEKVQEALSEIWNVVKARSEMEIAGRKWQVIEMAEWMRDEMGRSRFKGERTGFGSKARDTISGGVTWGNMTPEYFFKNLKNKAMDMLHKGLKIAEDRSGLEAAKAKVRLAEIAQANGFNTWDGQEEHQVRVSGKKTITMTTEQIMALYATWLREKNQMRPDNTAHLLNGGFVLAKKENKTGLPGREKQDTRPIRMSEGQLEAIGGMLTKEQKQYVDDMVAYMSSELAELGNEASMKMYGIKKFTEEYYFPIKSWGGVLNKRSDAGISSSNENRAAQQGFSKRIKNNASNAIEIGDFTPTAIKHVAGMITYNTVGPAIENLNKVLNQQLVYGEIKYTEDGQVDEDDTYKQNIRAAFTNAYGKQAGDYLAKFMKDMNGGVTTERTAFDKLLSIFKKNAVAGSLSVAAQQPLSYIRAAMMINPKYLAQAISPQYWKGSYAEMMKHSGVAVIKEMGKFDMNYGQTMQEWITPEGMESKAKKAWNKTTDLVTGLPGAMDMMTWTRMWTAVKLEQMAENRDMDYQSDEFMAKVAERFNDLMRQTQVYDSVMTKSQNMRSTHFYAKTLTSFMAEPTLSLNVLADAFQNMKEKGGKAKAIKAVATFLLSAAAQAGAKAFFGAGRTPDKKKNRKENFYNKFLYNLLSEANPFGLIPGYRQIIETLTDGEFKDDTMGMIAKFGDVLDRIWKLATGEIGQKGLYRDLEDSIGQALQLMTDIPAKNMMRDFRAMVNWFSGGTAQGFTGDTYAQRETSAAVLKYQLIDNLMSNDIMGLVNKKLDDAGYKTTNAAYYQRIVDAEKAGNQEAAEQMKEYLILKSDAADPEKVVNDAIRKLYKNDEDLSAEERLAKQKEYGLQAGGSFVTDEYKAGNLKRKDAERMYRAENPNASDKDVLKTFDKIDWEKSGKDAEGYTNYTPLYEAIRNNRVEEIRAAVKHMTDNGYKAEDIKKQLTTKYKQAYLDAKGSEKTKLMDALTKAYKAIGLSAEEALKIINGWKPKKESKKDPGTGSTGRVASLLPQKGNRETQDKLMWESLYSNTKGKAYGKGNIDLNSRKVVQNEDGSISTERSFSFWDEEEGKEILIPTVVNGRILSEQEAIDHYYRTGEYLGKFDTWQEADEYAEKLHERQDWYYHRN